MREHVYTLEISPMDTQNDALENAIFMGIAFWVLGLGKGMFIIGTVPNDDLVVID